MFRFDSPKLAGMPWPWFQALTGCGPLWRDLLDQSFTLVGSPRRNSDTALLNIVNQSGYGYAARFGGDISVGGNIIIDGPGAKEESFTLKYTECIAGKLYEYPYTFRFKGGIFVGVEVGEGVEVGVCDDPSGGDCTVLMNCEDSTVIVTDSDLSEYEVNDVLIRDDAEGGGYWTIVEKGAYCEDTVTFTVDGVSAEGCPEPEPEPTYCVRLVLCGTEEDEPVYLLVDEGALTDPDLGTIHERHASEGGGRWKVVDMAYECDGPDPFTEEAVHDECEDEPPPPSLYRLTRCDGNGSPIIVAASDLNNPSPGTVHRDGDGVCWMVVAEVSSGSPQSFTDTERFPADGNPCADCLGEGGGLCCWAEWIGELGVERGNGLLGNERVYTE